MSRPSRACGLKQQQAVLLRICALVSRPSRACGLKLLASAESALALASRPSRACGLKLVLDDLHDQGAQVTPLAGVRIETLPFPDGQFRMVVTPLAGVRIETQRRRSSMPKRPVTPLAGVRIETMQVKSSRTILKSSRPSRACGLKQQGAADCAAYQASRPSRACGLKHALFNEPLEGKSHAPRGRAD